MRVMRGDEETCFCLYTISRSTCTHVKAVTRHINAVTRHIKARVHDRLSHTNIKARVHDRLSHTPHQGQFDSGAHTMC